MTTERQSAERLRALLAGSLAVWGLDGSVALAVEGETARLTLPDGTSITVARGPEGWLIGTPEWSRRHAGTPALLRNLRRALAPEQQPGRMIVAPAPGGE